MPLLTWTTELSVNIKSIDDQHKNLMELISALDEAMRSGTAKEIVSPLFGEVMRFAAEHFAYEEDLMLTHGYPKYTEHKNEHEMLAAKVKDLARDLASGKRVSLDAVTSFLKEWLLKHIRTVDMAYSAFLVAKGVK